MKAKYWLPLILSGIIMTSCSDFLDLDPQKDQNAATFFKTADQIGNAVNGAYSTMQSNNMYGFWYILAEIPSDNTIGLISGSVTDRDEFDKFYLRTTNPYLANFWNESYRGINKCNTVLDKIDAVDMDKTLKERYKLEMKFLRGLFYFNLVRIFDGVPVVTSITSISQAYAVPRSSRDAVYTQIIKDFEAAEDLPAHYTGTDIGRATSGAAKAMLAKVYLTLNDYPNAEIKLNEVIQSSEYNLLENTLGSINGNGYASVFSPTNHNHKESVFDVQFKKGGVGEGSIWPNYFAPQNSPVVSVGSGGGDNIPTLDISQAYEPGDLRKQYSMADSYTSATGSVVNVRYVTKYTDVPYQQDDANNNFPVTRYADVLLMYAEALNENGKTSEACTYLNMVRRRGFGYQTSEISPYDINTADKDDFKLKVEHERRVELAFECHRWFDLIRTGRAVEVLTAKGSKINSTNLIYPIPQKQIDINPKVITQNDSQYN